MVLPEKADLNLISRTLVNIKSFAGSSGGDQEALPSSPSKNGNSKLISYQVKTKEDSSPLPIPRPIRFFLQTCCGTNMKWITFPVCCAFSLGLFLAFTRASTLVQYSNRGYSSYLNSRQLSHKEPQQMPDPVRGLFGGGGDGNGQNRMWAGPPCDCSKCLDREDIYNPGQPQYRTLIKHGLQHFYGHQDIAVHMSAFVPFKNNLWNLGFALYTTASRQCASDAPGNKNILAIVLVISEPKNAELRQAIRRTWGGKYWPNSKMPSKARLVFVVGASEEQRYNDVMLQESRTYDDMVLADVKEDKESRTKKILSGMKWVDMYCSHAQHILKVEDHVFLDLPRVLDILTSQDMSNMIYGSIIYAKLAHENQDSLIPYMQPRSYPLKWFPPHATGGFYVIPTNLSKRMLGVAMHIPYLPLEDIFITGILAKVFDARHINIPSTLLEKKEGGVVGLCDIVTRNKMAVKNVSPEVADSLWKRIQHPEMCDI